MKNYILGGVATVVAAQAQLVSAANLSLSDKSAAANQLSGTGKNLATSVSDLISYVAGFLYLIAVVYGMYGWFLILTAAGDEEKVKKGKTTLIHAILGLIVIFLAAAIIGFVISVLAGTSTSTGTTAK